VLFISKITRTFGGLFIFKNCKKMIRFCKRCKKENTNFGSTNCKKCDDRNERINVSILSKIDTSKKIEISLLGYIKDLNEDRLKICSWAAWKSETCCE
jgi:hypothetical protein